MELLGKYYRQTGRVPDFINDQELEEFRSLLARSDREILNDSEIQGIASGNPLYPLIVRRYFSRVAEIFNPEMQLIFAMHLNCREPFEIHHDLKPLPRDDAKHYLSFLIPMSANDLVDQCHRVSTIVFNEYLEDLHVNYDQGRVLENSAADLRHKINHNPVDVADYLSVNADHTWRRGDLIWWDSRLLHASNNFISDGVSSKQGIVLHSYVI
jgi:hypothetical protein